MQKRNHKRFVFAPIKCVKCSKKIELGEDYYTHRSGNEHCEKCYNKSMSKETEQVDPFEDDAPAVSSKITIHTADNTSTCISCEG